MKVCTNCFSDLEVIGLIQSFDEVGICDACDSNKSNVMELGELFDFFQELIDNFQMKEGGMPLNKNIQDTWALFSSQQNANKILDEVLKHISSVISCATDLVEYTDEIIKIVHIGMF